MKKAITILFIVTISVAGFSQQQPLRFSLATDVSILKSFKKQQQFLAIGQTIAGHFHLAPKDGAYIWLSYYSNGKFSNAVTATAKAGATSPQQIAYTNKAKLNFKHLSLGWKHYLRGAFDEENKWSLYGLAGFGLMMGRITNTHSAFVDTAKYNTPVLAGKASFKRLTLDLALGYEKQLGGDVFFYGEGRVLIPTTNYPSNYLFINNDAPFTVSANLGIQDTFLI